MTTSATPETPESNSAATSDPTPAPKVSTETKIKTFFEHIYDFLKAHLGSAASFEHTAATAISIAKPLLNTLLVLTAGEPIADKVAGVVKQVTTDLNDTSAILSGAEAGGLTLAGVLESVKSNLGTLLADADVKNSTKATQIEGVVNTIVGEVEAILAAAPPKSVGVAA